jgi:hypothetical protein
MSAVLTAFDAHAQGAEALPMILTEACVLVLPVAGAGLSITDDELRVPLGASDEVAVRAEVLQVTLGEGPCLDASASTDPLTSGEEEMRRRWPMFHRELLLKTPFRGVASFPLRSRRRRRFGALDLYVTDPEDLHRLSVNRVKRDIADQMASMLFDAPATTLLDVQMPVWMNSQSVTDRMNVWVAVGILIEYARLSNDDALAALRAYAFGNNQNLDQVADQLTHRRLLPQEVLL